MTRVLAIDPGNTESAYVAVDGDRRPAYFDKVDNHELLRILGREIFDGHVAIEMVASYGMPVGREVFETCVWIGRFQQTIAHHSPTTRVDLVYRREVKLHHCLTARAKDSNVRQALVDRFAPGQSNHGKGTKAAPGWFYGFRADVWQAYALGVYIADSLVTERTTA